MGSKLLPLSEIIAKAESEEQAKLTQAKLIGNKPAVQELVAVHSAGVVTDVGVRCKYYQGMVPLLTQTLARRNARPGVKMPPVRTAGAFQDCM